MQKPQVLIVDDNVIALKLLRKYLEASDLEVIEATDGHQCIAMAISNKPDIILLDVMMPKLDGYETIKRLKENDITRNIPVIILTALNDTANQLRAIESGADDFLSKPIEEKLILAKVKLFTELGLSKKKIEGLQSIINEAISNGFIERNKMTEFAYTIE